MSETLLDMLSKETTSPLRKYQELYVGGNSFLDLSKYEFLTFFLSPVPGALGFLLRRIFYPKLFATAGKSVIVGQHVTIRCPRRIYCGNNIFIDSNVAIDAKGDESRIQLGNSIFVGKNSILSCSSAIIEIGDDVSIGPNCFIRGGIGSIKIGSCITIGSHSVIISGNPDYEESDGRIKRQGGSGKGVTIGDDVWIGVGVRIIDGVNIGNGSVIGAGAVVVKDVPERAIVAAMPARVVRSRESVTISGKLPGEYT